MVTEFTLVTARGECGCRCADLDNAKHQAATGCADGETFAIRQKGKAVRFYIMRGRVAYPVSAKVAAMYHATGAL